MLEEAGSVARRGDCRVVDHRWETCLLHSSRLLLPCNAGKGGLSEGGVMCLVFYQGHFACNSASKLEGLRMEAGCSAQAEMIGTFAR